MDFRMFVYNHTQFLVRHAETIFKFARFSLFRRAGKVFLDPEDNHISYIPISEDVDAAPSTLVPLTIVEHFINKASYHAVINHCMCRMGMGCKKHDPYLGCMFLGEGAREIDPRMGKSITKEEALAHFKRAVESGLVPGIGKAKADALALGVKDFDHLMTLCFCCECCCFFRGLYKAPGDVGEILVKLEGVSIEHNQNCTGCGKCVEACIFKQINMVDGHPVIGDRCKGCGRCVGACEQNAITIHIDNPDYINQGIATISSSVSVT